jgi:hypothetical protein
MEAQYATLLAEHTALKEQFKELQKKYEDAITDPTEMCNMLENIMLVDTMPITPVTHMHMPSSMFVECINTQKVKEEQVDIWETSVYADICTLESNNVGNVGETFLQKICENQGIESCIDGTKTKQTGEKEGTGDGKIKQKTIEIKTARLGCSGSSFQHELGERPWISDYMVFIDVAPSHIYLTVFPNFAEAHYKEGSKCEPYFPTRKVTWRKKEGAFKLDTTPNLNEESIKKGNTIKITSATTFDDCGKFLNAVIA